MIQNSDNSKIVKIIVVGDYQAGKRSLVLRQWGNKFQPERPCTIICDFRHKVYDIGGHKLKAQFWETVGQQRFRNIPKIFYRDPGVVCLCFSLNERKTYENLNTWMKQIEQNKIESGKVYLIGCKADLKHQVGQQQIQNYVKEKKIKYFETSSLLGAGVEKAFQQIIKDYLMKIKQQQSVIKQTGQTQRRNLKCW